jgi:ribosomal-protein-alanine N-acetyltransferase
LISGPADILIQEGLKLRSLRLPGDEALIVEGMTDPEWMQYYGVCYETTEAVKSQYEWYRVQTEAGAGLFWVIEEQGTKAGVIGVYDIHPDHRKAEVGLWMLKSCAGRGLGTRSLRAVTQYAFDQMELHRLEAKVELENTGSRRVLEKSGWQIEGILRECEWKHHKWISLECWAVIQP